MKPTWFGSEGVVLRAFFLSLCLLGACSEAFAKEQVNHLSTSDWELGVVGMVNNHLSPSAGLYGLFLEDDDFEIHASAWTNILHLGGGGGIGTMHRVSSRFWFGWEASAEYELHKHESVWFLGLGPALEVPVVLHRLNLFLVVPVGWEHTAHHEKLEWTAMVGLTVALWH